MLSTTILRNRLPVILQLVYSTPVDILPTKWSPRNHQEESAWCKFCISLLSSLIEITLHSRAVLFTLSKQAKALEANKLCLQINKKLQALKPPPTVQDQIDNNYLHSKACKSGFNDPEELLPLCYKCSNYSAHLNGNSCPTCHQDFNFSFVSFGGFCTLFRNDFKHVFNSISEILPLVEFSPEMDITDVEAERLISAPPKMNGDADPFNEDNAGSLALTLDRESLRSIDPDTVLVVKHKEVSLRNLYFRNLLPELQITFCPECMLVRLLGGLQTSQSLNFPVIELLFRRLWTSGAATWLLPFLPESVRKTVW